MSQTYIERLHAAIERLERLENALLSSHTPLQISIFKTQLNTVSGSCVIIKWDNVVRSNDVEDDGLS